MYTKEHIQSLTEDDLRTKIVIPLFQAMRFTVYETHGAMEFGKDLIVYSRDNTGETVYSAVQIKTKDIHGTISSKGNIRSIIQQCELAFQIPFPDAFQPAERYVEKVYVVTSGKITTSAKTIIVNSLKSHGPVKFLDMEKLVALVNTHLSKQVASGDKEETLPHIIPSLTRRIITGCGYLYVTFSTEREKPFIIANLGKAGGCASSQLEAICSMVSLALERGASIDEVVTKLCGIRCPSISWDKGKAVLSCADAIGTVLQESKPK